MPTRTQRMGRKMMSRAQYSRGMQGQESVRMLAARLIAGEAVTPAQVAESVRPMPRSIGIDFDWQTGELSLDEPYQLVGAGVGVMDLCGAVTFNADWIDVLLLGDIPTGLLVESFNRAAADPKLTQLVMRMHTPGGSCNGMYDLSAAIDAFKATGKTLIAASDQAMLSLGVWIGCAADRIIVTQTGYIGSIGTMQAQYDDSKFYADLGIEPKFITSHPRKAQGYPGVALEEDLRDDDRRIIEQLWSAFRARVAEHRGLSEQDVEAMGARVYMGQDCVDHGLADELAVTFDAYLQRLVAGQAETPARAPGRAAPVTNPPEPAPAPEESAMDWKDVTPEALAEKRPDVVAKIKEGTVVAEKPATIAELKLAFPGAENAEFRETCNEKGLTLTQAKAERGVSLADQLKAERAKTATAEARVKELEALNGAGKGAEQPAGAAPPGKPGALDPSASKDEVRAAAKVEWAAMPEAEKARHGKDERVYAERRWLDHRARKAG